MKALKAIGTVVLAGTFAIVILSGFMCLYDLLPIHMDNPNGNTDYIWEPNSIWVKLTEGISWGRIDSNGYNNPVAIDNPDIIILGSSHMEAMNIFNYQAVGSLLAKKLDNRYSVYNLGISGQNLFTVCQYLPTNLEMYAESPRFAVIETYTVSVNEEKVKKVMSAKVKRQESYTSGIMGVIQRIPFFRCVYHQVTEGLLDLFMHGGNKTVTADADIEIKESNTDELVDEKAYNTLFQYLEDLEKKYGTQIIIFYHPTEILDEDNGIKFTSSIALNTFNKYAKEHDIDFIDMTVPFEDMYRQNQLVAHGFVTGRIGEGHLNANGHNAIANEVYRVIERIEKGDVLCK